MRSPKAKGAMNFKKSLKDWNYRQQPRNFKNALNVHNA